MLDSTGCNQDVQRWCRAWCILGRDKNRPPSQTDYTWVLLQPARVTLELIRAQHLMTLITHGPGKWVAPSSSVFTATQQDTRKRRKPPLYTLNPAILNIQMWHDEAHVNTRKFSLYYNLAPANVKLHLWHLSCDMLLCTKGFCCGRKGNPLIPPSHASNPLF